jgi:hypothetical protein
MRFLSRRRGGKKLRGRDAYRSWFADITQQLSNSLLRLLDVAVNTLTHTTLSVSTFIQHVLNE